MGPVAAPGGERGLDAGFANGPELTRSCHGEKLIHFFPLLLPSKAEIIIWRPHEKEKTRCLVQGTSRLAPAPPPLPAPSSDRGERAVGASGRSRPGRPGPAAETAPRGPRGGTGTGDRPTRTPLGGPCGGSRAAAPGPPGASTGPAELTSRKQKGTVSTLTPTMLFTTFMIRPQLEPAAAAAAMAR